MDIVALWLDFASLFFQFPIVLTVGTFFGALDVWGWPWFGALIFAMPGLLFAAPGVIGVAIGGLVNLFKGKSTPEYNPSYSYQRNDEPVNVTPPKKKKKAKKKKAKKKK